MNLLTASHFATTLVTTLDIKLHYDQREVSFFYLWILQVARRHLHRPILVYRLKQLVIIDGIPITDEERGKAELYFMDQQVYMHVVILRRNSLLTVTDKNFKKSYLNDDYIQLMFVIFCKNLSFYSIHLYQVYQSISWTKD